MVMMMTTTTRTRGTASDLHSTTGTSAQACGPVREASFTRQAHILPAYDVRPGEHFGVLWRPYLLQCSKSPHLHRPNVLCLVERQCPSSALKPLGVCCLQERNSFVDFEGKCKPA